MDVTAGAPTGSKVIPARHCLDLVAHKAYNFDVVQNFWSWMSYTAPDMPTIFDPVASPAPSADELAAMNKIVVRRENISGIAAKHSESTSGQGKSSVWVAVNGNYPLKVVVTLPGSQPILMLEVKERHFVNPDIALLASPANCTTHAQGSGSIDLKTGYTTGDVTVKSNNQTHRCFAQEFSQQGFRFVPAFFNR